MGNVGFVEHPKRSLQSPILNKVVKESRPQEQKSWGLGIPLPESPRWMKEHHLSPSAHTDKERVLNGHRFPKKKTHSVQSYALLVLRATGFELKKVKDFIGCEYDDTLDKGHKESGNKGLFKAIN